MHTVHWSLWFNILWNFAQIFPMNASVNEWLHRKGRRECKRCKYEHGLASSQAVRMQHVFKASSFQKNATIETNLNKVLIISNKLQLTQFELLQLSTNKVLTALRILSRIPFKGKSNSSFWHSHSHVLSWNNPRGNFQAEQFSWNSKQNWLI